MTTNYKPKLIEVALPLLAINDAAAAEGSIGQSPHPKNIHRWWARRPLAAVRAVLWASLVDDPSANEDLTAGQQEVERARLFDLLSRLVQRGASTNISLLEEARAEIDRCYPDGPPTVIDPFGGGGSIPLEAYRLGLNTISGDLNPVAVMIQKATIEIPRLIGGQPPVGGGESRLETGRWRRCSGLAADVQHYGGLLGDMVQQRVSELYREPTDESGGRATPIAWIWARTVPSPDPSWRGEVPLVASWSLSTRKGSEVWIEPIIDSDAVQIRYRLRKGGKPARARTVDRGNAVCLATGAAMPYEYLRAESQAGRMGQHLMAIVAERNGSRVYLEPSPEDEAAALAAPVPDQVPTSKLGVHPRNISPPAFGLEEWWQLFTKRQLQSLVSLCDELAGIRLRILHDAEQAGWRRDNVRLRDGGSGAAAYADAVVTYLAFVIDKMADFGSNICSWNAANSQLRYVFSRQAIPMTWDFAEINPWSGGMSSWDAHLRGMAKAIDECLGVSVRNADVLVEQRDARALVMEASGAMLSTDPPYYDNISYADLSDFFYVWLRESLSEIWPDECATLLTPKADELIANPYRAGGKPAAKVHFESGMREFMEAAASTIDQSAPATIYYAYKATETDADGTRSTGWDTFLQAILDAGLQVTATWPMRTERKGRSTAIGTNALASSIVLACRSRTTSARLASRGEFVSALRSELPTAVRILQTGNIAPVDLAQSTIGPGIRVFSRYAKVVEADGSPMTVSDALAIINDVLGEVLDGEDAELDRDTRFAVTWYTQNGYNLGRSGDADGQARAKNTSLAGIEDSGIGGARGGQFRLFERTELDPAWDPGDDARLTVWEATQHLVASLERSETEAAELLHRMGGYADRARQLAYVLFQKATEKGWAEEAASYNGLITAWPSLQSMGGGDSDQGRLL